MILNSANLCHLLKSRDTLCTRHSLKREISSIRPNMVKLARVRGLFPKKES